MKKLDGVQGPRSLLQSIWNTPLMRAVPVKLLCFLLEQLGSSGYPKIERLVRLSRMEDDVCLWYFEYRHIMHSVGFLGLSWVSPFYLPHSTLYYAGDVLHVRAANGGFSWRGIHGSDASRRLYSVSLQWLERIRDKKDEITSLRKVSFGDLECRKTASFHANRSVESMLPQRHGAYNISTFAAIVVKGSQ